MAKATHSGTCQACGREQKLPSNVLSNHGYVVKWNCFNGICPGSKEQPFELSCALIQKFIDSAKLQLQGIEEQISTLSVLPADDVKSAWIHEYRSGNFKVRGGYVWRYVEITATEETSMSDPNYKWLVFSYVDLEGKTQRIDTYGSSKTLRNLIAKQNSAYIEASLKPTAKQLLSYIVWQTERILNWKPAELKAVEPEKAPAPFKCDHYNRFGNRLCGRTFETREEYDQHLRYTHHVR